MLAVGLGGFVGANLRYVIALVLPNSGWPWATFSANMVGCFGLAFVLALLQDTMTLSEPMRLLITTGFFGALTTFSTFSFEVWRFLEQGDMLNAATYLSLSVVLGLAMSMAGYWFGHVL